MSQIVESDIDIERGNSFVLKETKAQKEKLEQAELDKHWKNCNGFG